jgi:hypothetical protein
MAEAVRVEGLRELNRAFKLYGKGLEGGIREALEAAAEPVKTDAQTLAVSSIPRIGLPWSRMRVGVTKHTAYIAPQQRGTTVRTRRGRPNLKGLLLGRAMEPALDRNISNVERELGDALDDLARMWARV